MKRVLSICLIYIFVIGIVLQGIPIKADAKEISKTTKALKEITGQVIFKVKDVKNQDYKKIIERYNGKLLNKNGQDVLIQVDNSKVQKIISELQKNSNIEFAEVNAQGTKQGEIYESNDENYLNSINGKEAWTLMPALSAQKQVTVAVVDSGVKEDHAALKGKVLSGGYNFVSNNSSIKDDNGHGTEVAGVIAAKEVNGNGVIGVAGNANVKILPVKVLDKKGNGSSYNVAQGIKYAANHGANIINVSIAGQGYSKSIEDAVAYAKSKNILVIAAAGDYKDYAENYWPCNVEGTIAVSDISNENIARSNFGKAVTFGVVGEGTTTSINSSGYVEAGGSSYAAAAVSGAAALASIKYQSYSSSQIESLMKNSISSNEDFQKTYGNKYGYGNIDLYKLMNEKSSLIEIISPVSGINSKGDISLKVKAVTPGTLSKLEIYLNDSKTAVNTIKANGAASYTYSVLASKLKDGVNKIAVKAYGKDGNTYTDFRYIREYKTNEHQFTLKFTGTDGKPLAKGVRVYLQKDGESKIVSDLTDTKGNVTFYNTDPNTNYNVFYDCDNVDSKNINHPIFFRTQVNSSHIPAVIDKTNLRVIKVSARKPNNTPLLGSKLFYGTNAGVEYNDVFDSKGDGYIYVTNASNLNIRLINEEEGYIIDKPYPKGMYGVNSINFAVDSTVTKVNIKNTSSSNIKSGTVSIRGNDDFANYRLPTVNVKNNAIYLSKGMDYMYYYESYAKANNSDYKYRYAAKRISTNKSAIDINYSKVHASLSQNYQNSNDSVYTNLTITDDYDNFMIMNKNTKLIFDLKDSKNKLIKEDKDINPRESSSFYKELAITSVASGNYKLEAKVDLGALGIVTGEPIAVTKSDTGGSSGAVKNNIKLTVKPPNSNMKNFNAKYKIYDNTNGNIIYNGTAVYDKASNTVQASINKDYGNSKYSIMVNGYSTINSGSKFSFIYNRQLSSAASSNITIDNTSNSIKQLSLKTDDTAKQDIIKTGDLSIGIKKYTNLMQDVLIPYSIDNSGKTSIYLDKNSYNFQIKNDKYDYWLNNDTDITSSNSTVTFSTKNLVKVTVKASNIKSFTGSSLYVKSTINNSYFYVDLTNNSALNVSPSLNPVLRSFTIDGFDMSKGKNIYYSYDGNDTALNKNLNIDLKDFTVKFNGFTGDVTLPSSITASYDIKSSGYKLNDIYSSSAYDFMNEIKSYNDGIYMNILDSKNKVVRSSINNSEYFYGQSQYAQLQDSSLPSGKYTASIIIANSVVNVTGNSFNVSVNSSNMQKIKIMNPFDKKKPANKAKIIVKGDFKSYYTDSNGYAYLNKTNITKSSDISIIVESIDGQSSAMYSPDSITKDSSGTINVNKAVSSLYKLHIKAVDTSKGINFANAEFTISSDYINGGISLNYTGEKNVYLPKGNYNIQGGSSGSFYKSDKIYALSKNINLTKSSDVVFDVSKLSKINVNSNNQDFDMTLTYSGDESSQYIYLDKLTSTAYVMPDKTIQYRYNSNNLNNSGSFTTAANKIKTINIGKQYSISSSLDKTTAAPFDTISANINITDEYKNRLSINDYYDKITGVIVQNGKEADRIKCSEYSNGKYLFNLNGNASGSIKIHFEIDLGNLGKKTTSDIPINISTDGYYVLNIKDPLGKPAVNAKVKIGTLYENESKYISESYSTTVNKNGNAYIEKSSVNSFDNKIIISGFTADNNDPFVYYRDYNINTTNYSSNNTKKTKIITDVNSNSYSSGNLSIYSDGLKLFNYYSYSYNNDFKNPNNFNLYLDKGIYSIKYNIDYSGYTYEDMSSYKLYKNNINSSIDNTIKFDSTNVSKIVPVYEGKLNVNNSNVRFRISEDLNNYDYSYNNTNNLYVSKNTYPKVDIDTSIYNDDSGYVTSLNFSKNNFTVKDDITEVHFGKIMPVSSDRSKLSSTMTVGGYATRDSSSMYYSDVKDSCGFNANLWNNFIINFSQKGKLIKSISSKDYWYPTVPNIPEGYYDVDVYYGTSDKNSFKVDSKRVYVAAADSSYINIYNYPVGPDINIYDGKNNVYRASNNSNYYSSASIPKNVLNKSKNYSAYVNGVNSYNSNIEFYIGNLTYKSSGYWQFSEPNSLVNFNVTNAAGMILEIKDSKGNTAKAPADGDGNIRVKTMPGNYTLTFSGTAPNGDYYLFSRSLKVTSSTTGYKVDYSNLNRLTINNKYKLTPYYGSYTFVKADNSILGSVTDSDAPKGTIYIDKGKYSVNATQNFRGVKNAITGKYAVDCSGNNSNLVFGSKLTVNAGIDKTSYNIGNTPKIGVVTLKDGAINLNGLSGSDFNIDSIDIMHGNKVEKSFIGEIPDYLSGQVSLKANISSSLFGNISSNTKAVNIGGISKVLYGDVNLDGIVDIFDLVLLSKDIGKTKAASADFDGRYDLDNSDKSNKIDIKDIAKASKNYNMRN